jgi:hypothetical protein
MQKKVQIPVIIGNYTPCRIKLDKSKIKGIFFYLVFLPCAIVYNAIYTVKYGKELCG